MRIFKQSYSDSYKLSYSDTYKLSYSDLFRVSIDPRVKPEGDRKESVSEGDERGRKPQYDNLKKSLLRAVTRGQAIFELVFFTLILSTSISQAECTPTPDCASIGYTVTSCDGKFARCPFDTTKLFCIPCDSSYKYICSGDNIINGTGSACNGKYASCNCADGYRFIDGQCCNDNCEVGSVLYSDMSCSSCVLGNKTAIGIVSYVNESDRMAIALNSHKMAWSEDLVAILPPNSFPSIDSAKSDFNGKTHTIKIVDYYGITSTNVAAVYCFNYQVAGMATGQWYLPADGELYESIYVNKNAINNTLQLLGKPIIDEGYHWSSSEYNYRNSWGVYPSGVVGGDFTKQNIFNVTCAIKF